MLLRTPAGKTASHLSYDRNHLRLFLARVWQFDNFAVFAKNTQERFSIEGFTVADAILVVRQTRKIYSECIGKIVILMLENLKKVDILQFL